MRASFLPSATFVNTRAPRLPSAGTAGRAWPTALGLLAGLALVHPAAAEVAAPVVDLHRACPDASAQLDRALAPALKTWGRTGSSNLVFRWDGTRAELVHLQGGPAEYRPALRQALRELACPGARRGELIHLVLRFDPDATER